MNATVSRRTVLAAATAAGTAAFFGTTGLGQVFAKTSAVKRVICYVPHPDDELLSMWPLIHYLACGYDVHFVYVTRGTVSAASLGLDGSRVCTWADHGYRHDPARENYELPTAEQIGLARLREGISAIGALSMIPPVVVNGVPLPSGKAYWHDENLPSNFGSGGAASSTAPVVPAAVETMEGIIRRYVTEYPGSLHYTMSPTDNHCDHGACGIALRNLQDDPEIGPQLGNSKYFVSRLYWGDGTVGKAASRPADVLAEACSWYPNPPGRNDVELVRRAEYTAWIKTKVVKAYTAWCPAAGQFAVGGGHSTPSQFAKCFGPAVTNVAALWHP